MREAFKTAPRRKKKTSAEKSYRILVVALLQFVRRRPKPESLHIQFKHKKGQTSGSTLCRTSPPSRPTFKCGAQAFIQGAGRKTRLCLLSEIFNRSSESAVIVGDGKSVSSHGGQNPTSLASWFAFPQSKLSPILTVATRNLTKQLQKQQQQQQQHAKATGRLCSVLLLALHAL